MRRLPHILALLLSAGLLAAPAVAADYESAVDLKAGTKINLTITRTRSGTRIATPATASFRYQQEVTPVAEGYRIRQTMLGATLPDGASDAEKASTEAAAAAVADMTFTADESLAPVRIEGWKDLAERMAKSMSGGDPAVAASASRLFGAMAPEAAAEMLMQEQIFLSTPQNMTLDLGSSLSGQVDAAYPLGGPPTETSATVRLESVDRAARRAVIRVTETFDPETARDRTRQTLAARAQRLPAERRPSQEALARLEIGRTLDCRSEMDMATGLALTTDCTQTVLGVDREMNPETLVDRWVITQALVAP